MKDKHKTLILISGILLFTGIHGAQSIEVTEPAANKTSASPNKWRWSVAATTN